jgi:hypothetical protein
MKMVSAASVRARSGARTERANSVAIVRRNATAVGVLRVKRISGAIIDLERFSDTSMACGYAGWFALEATLTRRRV